MEQNDFKYHVTMSLVRKMAKQGLLTADEYAVIDTKMRRNTALKSAQYLSKYR